MTKNHSNVNVETKNNRVNKMTTLNLILLEIMSLFIIIYCVYINLKKRIQYLGLLLHCKYSTIVVYKVVS